MKPILPRAIQITAMATGGLLVAAALAANQVWLDRHFLPLFFFPREKVLLQETLFRLLAGVIGLGLVLAGPAIHRLTLRMTAREIIAASLRIVLAVGLALAASELFLGRKFVYAAAEAVNEEPRWQPDPQLGWVFVPSRQAQTFIGGRNIVHTLDAHGYRLRAANAPVNTDSPAILFTGESIIAGYGLTWDESIPAQVSAQLKIQSVNMGVFGYALDQAYLRLKGELPRFRKPVAVVSLFSPSIFARHLDDNRPHLDSRLNLHPAVHRWGFVSLFRFLVPYRSDAEIEQGIEAARAILGATAALARERHAIALVVDPQYGPELPAEQMLRRRVLDEAGISYVRVDLDPAWRLHGDLHPDARAAHAIAAAIAQRLQNH